MIRALIFDFDGLIVDTELSAYESWQELYRTYGQNLPLEEWARCIGNADLFDPVLYLESLLGRTLDHTELLTRRRTRHLEMIAASPALPGVEDYIHTARRLGLKLGVASSSPHRWVEGHLQRLGLLEFFDRICSGDEVVQKKPDPEIFVLALSELKVTNEQAIVLEDSPNGVTAAQRAGIFCVAIPNPITGQLSLEHADLRLSSMAAMPLQALLDEVESRRPEQQSVSS